MLTLIEQSQFIEWFLISMWGFPVFIAVHSVGMAFVVGISFILALRYLEIGTDFTDSHFDTLNKTAWFGFLVNLFTGLVLLASRVTEYLIDPTFLFKILFVFIAVISLRFMQKDVMTNYSTTPSDKSIQPKPYLAVLTIVAWLLAITAGRWIAYLSGLYR